MSFLFLIVGLILYGATLNYPFVHDDIVFIVQNPQIARWDNLAEVFATPSISRNDTPLINSYYRPLLEVYYRMGYLFFGFNPLGFHLINILFHIFNAILVFRLLMRLGIKEVESFLIGLLFLIHPVQTQAVACISGISNLAMTFFCLGSIQCYCSFKNANISYQKYLSAFFFIIFYLLALLSKEQAVMLPLILLSVEYIFYKSRLRSLRAFNGLIVAGIFINVLFFVWRRVITGSQLSDILSYPEELKLRILAIPQTLLVYLKVLCWPLDLHYYRSLNILTPWMPYLIGVVFLLFTIILIIKMIAPEDRRYVYFGLLWFCLSLLPVLNIVPLIIEYSSISIAEHFLYFSSIGFFILAIIVIRSILMRYSRGRYELMAITLSVTIFFFLSAMTYQQKSYWRGEIPLFQRAIQFEGHLGRVHVLLGKAYFFQNRFEEAMLEFLKAQKIFEDYYLKAGNLSAKDFYRGYLKGIYFDLAQTYLSVRDFTEALRIYQKAHALDPRDGVILNNIATVFMQTGQWPQAQAALNEAIKYGYSNALVLNSLGVCAIQAGNRDEAALWFAEATKKDPHFLTAQENLKKLLTEIKP